MRHKLARILELFTLNTKKEKANDKPRDEKTESERLEPGGDDRASEDLPEGQKCEDEGY